MPYTAGLKALTEAVDRRNNKLISTHNLVKMAEFVLNNNYFEFKVKRQNRAQPLEKFAPTYACIFMDEAETKFRES